MTRSLFRSLTSYLHDTIWNIWVASLAATLTVYELLRAFIPSASLPSVPTEAYWGLGLGLLFIAPFRAFRKEQKRADIYESVSKQIFEESFVFLNYGKESRRVPKSVIDEGTQLLDEIDREVRSGDFSRAGMAIPLFHELYNLFLDYYGGSTQGTISFWNKGRAIVDQVLAHGFPDRALSEHIRSEAYEVYRERWARNLK